MNENFWQSKQMKFLVYLAIFMGIVTLASWASLNFEKINYLNPIQSTISVTGEGEVLAVPDIGQFSFAVTASAETASEAQEMSGEKINAILAYLEEQGIEEKDIKTQNYHLSPKWRYEEILCQPGRYCGNERVQDGFEVSQMIAVKLRDTSESGAVLTGVGELGATDISGLSFTIDDIDSLKAEARAKAIADGEAKAKALAAQLGVKIVRLSSFYENEGYYYPAAYESRAMLSADDAGGFGGAEIPVGEESTNVRVNLTYEIR